MQEAAGLSKDKMNAQSLIDYTRQKLQQEGKKTSSQGVSKQNGENTSSQIVPDQEYNNFLNNIK